MISLVVFLSIGGTNGEARIATMRKMARQAFYEQDYETAAKHYEGLVNASTNPAQSDRFYWSLALSRIGDEAKASKLLNQLAPGIGGNPGYEEAHQMVAISIASQKKKPFDALTIKSLRWHLDCSGLPRTPELNRAWAEYYLAVRDDASALKYMKRAAEVRPEFTVMVADIYGSLGDTEAQRESLKLAANFFQSLVENEPENQTHRIMYSAILTDLDQSDLAEQVLLAGIELNPAPMSELRTACSEFYLSQYLAAEPGDIATRFSFLKKSLAHDANHIPTYDCLIQFYRSFQNNNQPEAGKQIVAVLRESIASGESSAMAHLALSNILWVEKEFEESQFHMERAFQLDTQFAVVANNLAWLLAHADPPDLERAFELSSQVVKQHPDVGRLRDTLATILMKQKKYEQALAEFQRALPKMKNKKKVHENMAAIYRELGKDELALHHQQRAEAEPAVAQ